MARNATLALLLLVAAGCGYRSGYLVRDDIKTVDVPVFGNDTFYRGLEVDLTRDVVTEIEKRTPYRVTGAPSADAVLEARITDYRTTVLQEDAHDNPTEKDVVLAVNVTLKDARTGKVLFHDTIRDSDTFAVPLAETELTTRALLFRRAAVRIVEKAFERGW